MEKEKEKEKEKEGGLRIIGGKISSLMTQAKAQGLCTADNNISDWYFKLELGFGLGFGFGIRSGGTRK